MQKTNYSIDPRRCASKFLAAILLVCVAFPTLADQQGALRENLFGYYSREGNNGTPAKTARNNIYIKFFDDRWVGMMFIPYPYATEVDAATVDKVFKAAKKQTGGAAILRNKYDLLSEAATIQIERYGYLENRIIFECGALSPCTIRLGDGSLELIKPGVINEHIIKYDHVALP